MLDFTQPVNVLHDFGEVGLSRARDPIPTGAPRSSAQGGITGPKKASEAHPGTPATDPIIREYTSDSDTFKPPKPKPKPDTGSPPPTPSGPPNSPSNRGRAVIAPGIVGSEEMPGYPNTPSPERPRYLIHEAFRKPQLPTPGSNPPAHPPTNPPANPPPQAPRRRKNTDVEALKQLPVIDLYSDLPSSIKDSPNTKPKPYTPSATPVSRSVECSAVDVLHHDATQAPKPRNQFGPASSPPPAPFRTCTDGDAVLIVSCAFIALMCCLNIHQSLDLNPELVKYKEARRAPQVQQASLGAPMVY